MTNKELAKEIREIIKYLCKTSGKQDAYALQCCDELDRKLNMLDIFQNSLTVENHRERTPVEVKHNEDGSVETVFNTVIEFTKNKIEAEGKKALTEWVIENIDEELIKEWLFIKFVGLNEQDVIESL